MGFSHSNLPPPQENPHAGIFWHFYEISSHLNQKARLKQPIRYKLPPHQG
jgi:hypothetical protein